MIDLSQFFIRANDAKNLGFLNESTTIFVHQLVDLANVVHEHQPIYHRHLVVSNHKCVPPFAAHFKRFAKFLQTLVATDGEMAIGFHVGDTL